MNRLLLTCGLAGMTLCWLYPWSVLLGLWARPSLAQARPLLGPGSIGLLLLLGAAGTHFVGRRAGAGRRSQLSLALLGLGAALLAVRFDQYPTSGGLEWLTALATALAIALGQPGPPSLAFALGVYLWWRGVRLGSQTPHFTDVEGAFRWGIGWLAVFGGIVGLTLRPSELPAIEAETLPYAIGFFCTSLLTLALARLESLRSRTRALALNTQWLGVLVAVVAGLIVVALLIAQVVSFNSLVLALQPLFQLLGLVVIIAIYIIVIPLAYVVQFALYLLLQLLHPDPLQPPPQPLEPASLTDALGRLFQQQLGPETIAVIKAGATLVLVGLGLLLVARAASRWRPTSNESDAVAEERESVWQPGSLRRTLLAWLWRLLGRRLASPATAVGPVTAVAEPGQAAPLSSVRAIYRQLLHLGESAGARRGGASTPYEHLPALQRVLGPPEEVAALTQAYVQVRYAEQEPGREAIDRARQQLERVGPTAPETPPAE